jgi:serine/threonine protein kinase/WD40 repeat protein
MCQPTSECPELERWQELFNDALPPEQVHRLERHLESCAFCQERLQRAQEGGELLRSVGMQLGDPTVVTPDPTLVQVLERLHVRSPVRAGADETPDLYFLRPTDDPDLLGMLGDYEVQEVIGQGGMGIVLKACDPALHRLVAIKVMAAALAGSATARLRFTREAQAGAAVSHDHVVVVHGVHETDGLPYLVMEYIAGESLQERIDRSGPLELTDIVRIGLQTASGLAAAHAQGLIHRDIKPANLLLENGLARVTITDFGLARSVDDVQLTQNGAVAGTPEYMAPEQARGDVIDHRADLFSLGSVLYAMCTGVPPFAGSTALAVLRHVSDETPPPVRSLNPAIPEWLETLIERLMAKAPAARLQSAAQVAALLEGYLAHLRQPATVPAPRLPRTVGDRSRRSQSTWPSESSARLLRRLCVLAVVVLATIWTVLWLKLAQPAGAPQPDAPQEYYQSFKGAPDNHQGLALIGPDASQCVRFEPDGLRITLPAGNPRRGTGVSVAGPIKGDFDVSVRFEILHELEAVDRNSPPTRFVVDAGADRERKIVATLSRQVAAQHGSEFLTWLSLFNETTAKNEWQSQAYATAAKTGRLRLTRSGALVSYSVAEGAADEFTVLQQLRFVTDDLEDIRVMAATLSPQASFDVRVTDLDVRAKAALNLPMPDTPAAHSHFTGGDWLLLAVGLSLALTCVFGIGLFVRQRRGAAGATAPVLMHAPSEATLAAATVVAITCTGCGKKLKAKADLAGKSIKCPNCGKAADVPATAATVPPPSLRRNPGRFALWSAWWFFAPVLVIVLLIVGFRRFLPLPPEPASFLDVPLGSTLVNGIAESGFHHQEYSNKGQPFRWTDGHGKLVIPIDKARPPQALLVELRVFRPPTVAGHVKIVVNEQELCQEQVRHWIWWQTFDLRGLDLGNEVTVEVFSDTFVPKGVMDGGANMDQRSLGVQVWGVKLLPTIEEKPAPAAVPAAAPPVAVGRVHARPMQVWDGHPEGITSVALTPDGKTLVTGGFDGTILVWDVSAQKLQRRLFGHGRGLQAIAVTPDGKTVAAAPPGPGRPVQLIDVATDTLQLQTLPAEFGALTTGLALAPEGKGPLLAISPLINRQPKVLRGHPGVITGMAFSPDGNTLAVAVGTPMKPGALKLWHVPSNTERVRVESFRLRIWGLAYSRDGQKVAVACGDNQTYLVETATGKVLASYSHPENTSYARRVAMTADGKRIAVAYGEAGHVRLYELNGGRPAVTLTAPAGALGLDFSRDGQRLLVACADGTATLWDVTKPHGELITTFGGHQGPVFFALFLPDGRTVVTGGDDRLVRLWRVDVKQ